MSRDPRYDVLFEPVRIGPVTARNRFYQVPHCNGMGRMHPSSVARMRGIKAEGGWAVICTEEVDFHVSGESTPYNEGRLWDDADIPYMARMTDAVHAHGALAGIELAHPGGAAANLYSREVPVGPSVRPVDAHLPVQVRAMDRADIREMRRLHVEAATRAKRAGFDVIYVYAGHQLTVLMHFLSRARNTRSDEYGGSLENRARLLREVLEDTKEAVGDSCAIALRFAVDELSGPAGIEAGNEGRDLVEMLADLPDLWDVNVSAWEHDSQSSRFAEEGFQEDYTRFVKEVTSKPVVGVGRYTSPDRMVSLVKSGHMDFIGAARPSIADPFLPKKIEEGRVEDIRECIGCNICVSGDQQVAPIRCTQNPTMGEEWRRGWHPERIARAHRRESVLVVGAGPAGLEAARALGQRGYEVTLAEKGSALGGRLLRERELPGLNAWFRVVDYRAYQIGQMPNVQVYLESEVDAAMIAELAPDHVALATGAHWVTTGEGRSHAGPIPAAKGMTILGPDDVMAGKAPEGPVVIFDDDHYYMGGALAEKLRAEGHAVTLVTPAPVVSEWTRFTLEQGRIQTRLMEMGVRIVPLHTLSAIAGDRVTLACVYTGRETQVACACVVPVTMRRPEEHLWHALQEAGAENVTRIGDALAPGTIAAAVWSGHRYARELGERAADAVPFAREIAQLAPEES
ncbi:NAD(P)-binding protein [Roseovarius sp. SCSIO 43702]|uniref:oxidoreductase n=1 Tax=Roseovarius sp. SCSIO 43702 TaxID=2823043 RepID=UPI001C737B57|nr:NAD(P)-binding protein [Roseovarius sp. SCSIO 43702]QYX56548.1 NAD(P)-binding protein [Roseovarius sp. SCSIO 43702]